MPASAARAFSFQVYDPTYFVAFSFAAENPVSFVNAPPGCSTNLLGANPLAAVDQLLERLVVNNARFREWQSWLQGPVVFLVIVTGLLLLYAAPRLRLSGGWAPFRWRRVPVTRSLIGGSPVAIGGG